MAIFSVGGTTYRMTEETLGFYAIIPPVIVVGAGTGTLASTVNPFATEVASDAAGRRAHHRGGPRGHHDHE